MNISLNAFRLLADASHTASKLILIAAIHRNRSAQGVSFLTQLLYTLVFVARYLDLFWEPPQSSWYLFGAKLFYIASSVYLVVVMRWFPRTREKEAGWKLAVWSLIGSLASAPFVCALFRGVKATRVFQILWTFSIILESVCVLPQLLLLRQTRIPTVLDSYYLVMLGSYRFFYILNWIYLGVKEGRLDRDQRTSAVFGVIQTLLYIDFAWVYFSRQRVKLRGGGIVDNDDLSKSFFVRRFIGRRRNADGANADDYDDDDGADEEAAVSVQGSEREAEGRRWGPGGISVRADDTLPPSDTSDAQMVDPSHFEDEDEDEDDVDAPLPPAKDQPARQHKQARAIDDSATAWREGSPS